MMPALDWLQNNAGRLGTPSPALFYWGSGLLSSLLDNAPTYLSFLSAAFGLFVDPEIVDKVQLLIQNHGADLAGIAGPHAEAVRPHARGAAKISPGGARQAARSARTKSKPLSCSARAA